MKKYRQPSKEIYRLSKEIEDTKKQVELLKLKNKITGKKKYSTDWLSSRIERTEETIREVKDRTIPNLNNRERKTN